MRFAEALLESSTLQEFSGSTNFADILKAAKPKTLMGRAVRKAKEAKVVIKDRASTAYKKGKKHFRKHKSAYTHGAAGIGGIVVGDHGIRPGRQKEKSK